MNNIAMLSRVFDSYKKLAYFAAATLFTFLSTATFALAEDPPGTGAARGFVEDLNRVILFPLIGLLMGVALLVFIIGCVEYIMGAGNPTAREKGVKHITYSIIGMVVMVSAWAILNLVAGTFGLDVMT